MSDAMAAINGWIGERRHGADISHDLFVHLQSGIAFAVRLAGSRYDPLFSLGSEETYYVRATDGWRGIVLAWGNTDGYGLLAMEPKQSFVPAVADVLLIMRQWGCSQDDAVCILGGKP